MDNLFSQFEESNYEAWRNQLTKDLKGITVDELKKINKEGIVIEPYYTSEKSIKATPYFSHTGWDICEHIEVNDEENANQKALAALNGGASGICFYINKKINTKLLIQNISLEHIYCAFYLTNDCLHVIDDLKNFHSQINPHELKIKCFVLIDPLHLLVKYGEWHSNQIKDLELLNELQAISINAELYQNAGATLINELAITLSHLNEYLNYLNNANVLTNKKIIHLTCSVGSNFFMEIAKIRAYRNLINLIQKQYNILLPIHIHVNTTQINKSNVDAYTNLLRTTTEGMSAIIGGCNSLCVLPYNIGFVETNSFSERIARNQQHILKEESYLDKVCDVSKGSFYIETITQQIAETAWEKFKEIENKGGFVNAYTTGLISEIITTDANNLISLFKEEKIVLVGVNKYKNSNDNPLNLHPHLNVENKSSFKSIKPIRLVEHKI
jgi:methylmalonyl-CoA mutase